MHFRRALAIPAVLLAGLVLEAGPQTKPAAQKEADLCAVPSNVSPALPAVLMEGTGKSDFPITTRSPEAQAFFNQGIAQMHSFWFRESERSFKQAAAIDPDAAMAYWGIAISASGDYRPAFQLLRNRSTQYQQQAGSDSERPRGSAPSPSSGTVRAREAIAKAMELRSKVSERERLYIEALAARRNPDSKDPDGDYVRGMRKLVAAYPDDLEAKSILALAIQNGYYPVTKEPRDTTLESLALLKEILAKDPDHVGAHHYVIHGYEGGKRPQDAWDSCKRYPELVPNIPHALHMPGHIYAQSGRLEDAVHAFSSAALNELGYMAADVLYGSGHYAHNHHFLVHSLGLQGRYIESVTRSREIMSIKENPREAESVDGSSAYRQGWFALMKTLVRFEKWEEILDGKTLPHYNKPRESAWYQYARGLALASKGDFGSANEALVQMKKSLGELKTVPPQVDAAKTELEGYIAARSGKPEKGMELLRKAAKIEAELLYTEPPAYPRPVLELLGKTALLLKDYKSAESAYRELMELELGNGRALWGLAHALRGQGKNQEAAQVFEEFARVWSTADTDLPEILEIGASNSVKTAAR